MNLLFVVAPTVFEWSSQCLYNITIHLYCLEKVYIVEVAEGVCLHRLYMTRIDLRCLELVLRWYKIAKDVRKYIGTYTCQRFVALSSGVPGSPAGPCRHPMWAPLTSWSNGEGGSGPRAGFNGVQRVHICVCLCIPTRFYWIVVWLICIVKV